MRYKAAINKPGFNPLGAQTSVNYYSVFMAGANNYGQLGLGDTTDRSSFTQVGSNYWTSISNANYYSFAVQLNGTLWSWGQNQAGQLGLNNLTYYSSPKQVGALTNWATVSAGGSTYGLL